MKEQGIVNITDHRIALPNELNKPAMIIVPVRSREITLSDFVLAFFSPVFKFISTTCNNNQSLNIHADEAFISERDIRDFIGMVVENLAHPCDNLRTYLRRPSRRGLADNRWQKIISLLEYRILDLVAVCNQTFKQCMVPASQMVYDETMLAWTAADIAVVEVKDKPIKKGVKVFNVSFRLEKTDRSYCWHFIPDLGPDRISVAAALDLALASLPTSRSHVLTADKWFGSISWAQAHPAARVVFNLSRNQDDALFSLLERGLPEGHYRVYRWSNTLLSLWHYCTVVYH